MKYPLPFYETTKREYKEDRNEIRKTFRLAILCEQLIKFHTSVIVQNFLQTKELRAEGKAYLGRGLQRPGLGLWAFFTETIHPLIDKKDLYWRDFPEYFKEILEPITGMLVPFRNRLHHGPAPSEKNCLLDQAQIFPLIEKLENGGIVGRDRLVVGEFIQGSSTREIELLADDGRNLRITPLLYYKQQTEGVSSKLGSLERGKEGLDILH